MTKPRKPPPINGAKTMTLDSEQIMTIRDALTAKAERIRIEAMRCARAVKKFDDPEVRRIMAEAAVVDKLAARFKP